MQLTKKMMALAAFVLVAQAAPAEPQTLDLSAAEAALHNPDNLPTVWVIDRCEGEVCDLTKGHLEIAGEFNTKHGLSPNPDFTLTAREADGIREICSNAYTAASSACSWLIDGLTKWGKNIDPVSTRTRSICVDSNPGPCCVSWSVNGSFSSRDLGDDARGCFNVCATASVSCQAQGVELGGKIMDVCVSNRPDGCT